MRGGEESVKLAARFESLDDAGNEHGELHLDIVGHIGDPALGRMVELLNHNAKILRKGEEQTREKQVRDVTTKMVNCE
jgi:hypothetical protein